MGEENNYAIEAEENKDSDTVKTFTQEEVNKIVENRLNRERKRMNAALTGEDPRELQLAEREKALQKRELQAEIRPKLTEKGFAEEVLNFLDYTDSEKCNKSLEALESVIDAVVQKRIGNIVKGGNPMKKAPQDAPDAAIRAAFKLPAR